MNEKTKEYIDHEVRLQLLERIAQSIESRFEKIDLKFDKLNSRIDTGFLWIIGLIITSMFIPVVLHALKLI